MGSSFDAEIASVLDAFHAADAAPVGDFLAVEAVRGDEPCRGADPLGAILYFGPAGVSRFAAAVVVVGGAAVGVPVGGEELDDGAALLRTADRRRTQALADATSVEDSLTYLRT